MRLPELFHKSESPMMQITTQIFMPLLIQIFRLKRARNAIFIHFVYRAIGKYEHLGQYITAISISHALATSIFFPPPPRDLNILSSITFKWKQDYLQTTKVSDISNSHPTSGAIIIGESILVNRPF